VTPDTSDVVDSGPKARGKPKTCAEQGLAVDCATTRECHVLGLCTFDPTGKELPIEGCYCKATTDQECEQSHKCYAHYACKAHKGACQQTTKLGACWPGPLGQCAVHGLCGDYEGSCLRPTQAACAMSEACRLRGECHSCPKNGICKDPKGPYPGARCWAVSDADCAQSAGCLWRGECELASKAKQRGGEGRACSAYSHAACASSLGCKYKGACALGGDGQCRITAEGCAKSVGCSESGQCGTVDGFPYCVPTTAAHCAAAEDCKRFGQCNLDAVAHVCRK